MVRTHYYRLFFGVATLGLSSFILKFMEWVFAESHGSRLLIPAFCLLIVVSYPIGMFIDFAYDLKGRDREK